MARAENTQLNVRSTFARERVQALAKLTGMTASEVAEDALRGYVPPGHAGQYRQAGPARRAAGSPASGRGVSLEEANDALDRSRERDPGH